MPCRASYDVDRSTLMQAAEQQRRGVPRPQRPAPSAPPQSPAAQQPSAGPGLHLARRPQAVYSVSGTAEKQNPESTVRERASERHDSAATTPSPSPSSSYPLDPPALPPTPLIPPAPPFLPLFPSYYFHPPIHPLASTHPPASLRYIRTTTCPPPSSSPHCRGHPPRSRRPRQ